MQTENKRQFLEAISSLAALFSRELDDAAIALYWEAIRDMSIPQFQAAVRKAAKECSFFPPPVKLLEFAGLDPESNARTVWSQLVANGIRGDWSVEDRIGKEALSNIGGAWRLRHASAFDLQNRIRNEFLEQYRRIASTRNVPELPPSTVSEITDG